MMAFDVSTFLIFVKLCIRQFAFLIKRHGVAVDAIHIKIFSENASSQFVPDLFPGFLIMLKKQIINGIRIVRVSAFNMF